MTPSLPLESYIFSEPRVIYTTKPRELFIYGWSSDSKHLLVNGYNYEADRYTLEAVDVQSGIAQTYAERQSPGWAAWLPQQQAIAYNDSEFIDPQSPGKYRENLWVSWGSPQQAKRVATGVDYDSPAIDPAGRVTFFPRESGGKPLGPRLQRLDVTTEAQQTLALDLAQWDFHQYAPRLDEPGTDSPSRRVYTVWRPGTTSQILLYFADVGLLLADTQTGQICEIELRRQNKPLAAGWVTWSPNGRYLAIAAESLEPEGRLGPLHLMIVDMNTGQQFFPDLGAGELVDIKWGASSQQIAALMRQKVPNGGRGTYRLYLVNAGSQVAQQILPQAEFIGGGSRAGMMTWSPDGSLLAINCPSWQDDQVITAARLCLISVSKAP